jgi:hypothetical protein
MISASVPPWTHVGRAGSGRGEGAFAPRPAPTAPLLLTDTRTAIASHPVSVNVPRTEPVQYMPAIVKSATTTTLPASLQFTETIVPST